MNHRDVMKKLLENFTDTEIMAIQGATYFHRDLATRYCEGAEFADRHGNIYPAPLFRVNRDMYVEVWPKIKIGKTEINAPFSCKPEHGAEYWFFIIAHNKVYSDRFYGVLQDNIRFDAGNCFREKDDALAALNAIKSLLKGK
jgi:hypothetical protein